MTFSLRHQRPDSETSRRRKWKTENLVNENFRTRWYLLQTVGTKGHWLNVLRKFYGFSTGVSLETHRGSGVFLRDSGVPLLVGPIRVKRPTGTVPWTVPSLRQNLKGLFNMTVYLWSYTRINCGVLCLLKESIQEGFKDRVLYYHTKTGDKTSLINTSLSIVLVYKWSNIVKLIW